MDALWQWDDIFKVLKDKTCQSKILSTKLSFKNEDKIQVILCPSCLPLPLTKNKKDFIVG